MMWVQVSVRNAIRGAMTCALGAVLWAGFSDAVVAQDALAQRTFIVDRNTISERSAKHGASGSAYRVLLADRGGSVRNRAQEIITLRGLKGPIELRGPLCLSSCTMYLALPDLCIHPETTFGFHGPSYYGRALSARDFEYWSQVIADHYPKALRHWYLETGRYRSSGYFRIKGSTLIKMGLRRCPRL